MKKLLVLGLVVSAVAALLAFITVRSLGPDEEVAQTVLQMGEKAVQSGGNASPVGIKGIIKYTVRDANGNVKESAVIYNTVNDPEALDEVFNRIARTMTGGAYDAIGALAVDAATDDPSDGVLAGSITLNLDGDSGTVGNQNPADDDSIGAPSNGDGTIDVTFTAQADSVNVKQIVLTKAAEDDTSDGAVAIADADIFAYVDVPDVTLDTNDTVQYTWTVDVD